MLERARQSLSRLSVGDAFGEQFLESGTEFHALVTRRALPRDASVAQAVRALGSGQRVLSQDTVPFCLWCVAWHVTHYAETLWTTVAGHGDCDTTCAIVGGIVVCATGVDAIPAAWLNAREPLPELDSITDEA